jgi:hypothetical protein
MIKNNKWRLVSDVLVMFPVESPNTVFITNLDNKKQEALIASDIEKYFNTSNTAIASILLFVVCLNPLYIFLIIFPSCVITAAKPPASLLLLYAPSV